jgi:3-hydroxybutyryl-CoA dehydrogenase
MVGRFLRFGVRLDYPPLTERPGTERLAVAGSGAIACGLAAAAAAAEIDVILLARSEESADRARAHVEKVAHEDASLDGVTVTIEAADIHDSTFVVEAIAEHEDSKARLLSELNEALDEQAVLATTTSSLSIERLAEASGRPTHFAGFHVFNPVTKMKLVELAFPTTVQGDTRERALALCTALGKTPVEVPDVPGFVVNRLLFPYLFSAVRLLEETELEPEAIDECMKLGAAHPLGPLALLDMVGLDVSAAIGDEIGAEVPQRIRDLVAAGKLGRKTGSGLYEY